MSPLHDNEGFWRGDDAFIAANPDRPHEADGLADFARAGAATRRLLLFQTSGTEGEPKWCGLSREAMQISARAVNAHLDATARDRWLIALPMHHVGGFSILARCFAGGGSWARMNGKWDAARFAELCRTEAITLTSLVPAQVFDLVRAGLHAPPSLRAVVVGGAALDRDLGTSARALGWRVLQSYGMTETASQVATEPLAHLDEGFDPDRLEVLDGWDLRCDAEGRLMIRGSALASGYALRREGAWHWEAIDREAGLRTRDRVDLWSDGSRRFLRFLGRDAEFVKVLGELVNLAALQRRLDALGSGRPPASALIRPVRDERTGSRLLLVGPIPIDELEELRSRFNATAQGFERLGEVRSIAAIPRTAMGKINHAALDEMLRG